MRQSFEAHSTEYEQLVKMLEVDQQVETIGPGYKLSLSEARQDEYRTLMKRTDVERIDRFMDGSIHLMVWATGGMDTTRHKCIVYLPGSPPTDTRWDFVPIRGRWYIVQD